VHTAGVAPAGDTGPLIQRLPAPPRQLPLQPGIVRGSFS
jgi:hypothetical protein